MSRVLKISTVLIIFIMGVVFFIKGMDAVNSTTHGIIWRDEIWRDEIHIDGDIIAMPWITLTIEPATRVLIAAGSDVKNYLRDDFNMSQGIAEVDDFERGVHAGEPFNDEANHISIIIYGKLSAVGKPGKRINITSEGDRHSIYDWNFFEFHRGEIAWAYVEYYRGFNPTGGTIVRNSTFRNVGACALCPRGRVLIQDNEFSFAGHELIDIHISSPIIRNNKIGPNPDKGCIVLDRGKPEIVGNIIEGCQNGIHFIEKPDFSESEIEELLTENTFSGHEENIRYDRE